MTCKFAMEMMIDATVPTDVMASRRHDDDDDVVCCLQLDGDIGDCACSIESVDHFNNEQVFPIIDDLMLRNYFRYYKVLFVVCVSNSAA